MCSVCKNLHNLIALFSIARALALIDQFIFIFKHYYYLTVCKYIPICALH